MKTPGWGSGLQQRHQAAFGVQGHQVVTAAHMGVAHVNLRHGATPSGLHHVVALGGVQVDADFFNLLNTLGFEQLLGADAVGTETPGVDEVLRYQLRKHANRIHHFMPISCSCLPAKGGQNNQRSKFKF